jgi:hypothetical protein
MNDDWPRLNGLVWWSVFQIEPLGQLEIKLYSRTLKRTTKGILDRDVNFGPIKRAISKIFGPFSRIVFV